MPSSLETWRPQLTLTDYSAAMMTAICSSNGCVCMVLHTDEQGMHFHCCTASFVHTVSFRALELN